MAFLDNSGDIIIDAVLTDTGRYRLAQGDGSFKIEKFALGDDEIDYALYDVLDPSATADLEIMQTPILEAFTDNAASQKSKLVTYSIENLLYMPVMLVNNLTEDSLNDSLGMYVVAVDAATEEKVTQSANTPFLFGENVSAGKGLRIDQGLNTTAVNPQYKLGAERTEEQYIIQIDSRLGMIASAPEQGGKGGGEVVKSSWLDDDQIAYYYISKKPFVRNNSSVNSAGEVISGPRGTTLSFAIQSSIDLNTSTYLFELLGTTGASMTGVEGNISFIDTTIRIQGQTTGAQLDLPVRFIKSE